MIKPIKKGNELLAEMNSRKADPGTIDIWWLGQSGYLIHWNGKRILLDPYLSDSLTKKYVGTDKPHTRISELVIDPALLTNIDFISSSHVHTDHLDPDTLKPLFVNNPECTFIIPEAHRVIASVRADCPMDKPIGLDLGFIHDTDDVSFIAVPAAHETLDRDHRGHSLYLGYIIKIGPWTLYHSGDTILFPGMEDILKDYPIDVSFLPINGADPKRKVAGNLNAAEAVWLASQINTKWVIPGHYDMFEFNTADPNDFIALADLEGMQYKVMQLGELFTLTKH